MRDSSNAVGNQTVFRPPSRFRLVVGPAAHVVPHRDAVADGDLFGADENVLDEQVQDALAFGDGRRGGLAAQPGEEVFEASLR